MGATWTDDPSGTYLAGAQDQFNSVSCTGPGACVAVGAAYGLPVGAIAGVEVGGTWSIAPALQMGAGALEGSSCVSSDDCFAVGFFNANPGGTSQQGDQPLIERWDGATWSPMSNPSTDGHLINISCGSQDFCLASGFEDGHPSVPVIETWNGLAWSIISAPPEYSISFGPNALDCFSSGGCLAVGSNSTTGDAAIDSFDGSNWSGAATLPGQTLLGISCSDPDNCIAVGSSIDSWTAGQWSEIATPDGGTYLSSVSCDADQICMAVGTSTGGPGNSFIEQGPIVPQPPSNAPEVPFTLALPVLAFGITGGALFVRRRKPTARQVH